MTDSIHVDLEALDALIARTARFDARAAALICDADVLVTRVRGEWAGTAAQAHVSAHGEWARAMEQMRTALDQLRRHAAVAHANYIAAVQANVRMWG